MQEGKYGRNCRRSSSSADCNASVWYKNWETVRGYESREKKNGKWRNIKNTNKYDTYTTRTKTNIDSKRDLWNTHTRVNIYIYTSSIESKITRNDDDVDEDDETAVVDTAQ